MDVKITLADCTYECDEYGTVNDWECSVEITREGKTETYEFTHDDLFRNDNWDGDLENIYKFVFEKLGFELVFTDKKWKPNSIDTSAKNLVFIDKEKTDIIHCYFHDKNGEYRDFMVKSYDLLEAFEKILQEKINFTLITPDYVSEYDPF